MTTTALSDEREQVMAMTDDELSAWVNALRMKSFFGLSFKRLPWSESVLIVWPETTLDDVRMRVRESSVGRRKEGAG